MKKFIVYLLVIILAVSMGFAVFYLVRDNEVISISSASIYKDNGDTFQIDVNHQNKKSYTNITVSTSNASVVSYDKNTNTFKAEKGGVARINFRTTNAKFRNLWCDVIVGDGTVESPYYISTPEQLASIGMGIYEGSVNGVDVYKGSTLYDERYEKYSSDKCYKLVGDIDVKDVNEGYWLPLRNFSGRFDGNGFTISNISIDRENYINAFKDSNTYDSTIFSNDVKNVGMFQSVDSTGLVYNFKLDNVYASGIYDTFGVIAGENKGTIERVEVKYAYLSVETKVFGGLVGKNTTSESGENDSYERHIARIDRCSINMVAGKKYVTTNDSVSEEILGMNGLVGGLVGVNEGGQVVYSYATGEVSFGSDSVLEIIYGGIIANNKYISLNKIGGSYTSKIEGANIKDCYSDLKTNFGSNSTNSDSLFAGAIAINEDFSNSTYKDESNKEIVNNYLVGIYYNKDNLNYAQTDITKNFTGISKFVYNSRTIDFTDKKTIVYGLTNSEMKVGDNYVSHYVSEIEFNENGESLGLREKQINWLFGSVWTIDDETNDGKPYLNYQLIYIPDDFASVGVATITDRKDYGFEKPEVDATPKILSGNNGIISMQVGEEYVIKVSPSGISFNWYSSDTNIATVDSNGKVKALREGRVSITVANKSGITDSVTVIITDKAVSITNVPSQINLKVGETYTLNPKTYPVSSVSYRIYGSNSAVSVSNSGTITGLKEGIGYVYVIASDSSVRVRVNVYEDTSYKVVNLNVKDNETVLSNGETLNKTYTGSSLTGKLSVSSVMYNSTNVSSLVTLTYKSDNTNVLTIDNNGNYIILGSGKANVTISADGNNYYGSFIVSFDISSSGISEILKFNVSSYTLYIGQSFNLIASGTTKTPIYSSVDPTIATVSSTGVVTGISAGSTTVYAYIQTNDGSYSYAYCIVSVKEGANKSITVTPKQSYVNVGDSVNIMATITGFDAGTVVSWSYLSQSFVDVDVNGSIATVKMNGEGTFTITAVIGNVSDSATIVAVDTHAYSKYIYNATQLNNIRYNLDKDYVIANDIDLSGWNWEPIGTLEKPFTGNISNLGNYKISNLQVTETYTYAGLFGYTKNSKIENIYITKANITGDYVGAIAGYTSNTGINACTVSDSTLTGKISTGGIVGYLTYNSVINSCNVLGNMEITTINNNKEQSKYVGGIAGMSSISSISSSSVDMLGTITLGSSTYGYAGGIVGYASGDIKNVYVRAIVCANNSDKDYAGGIVGYITKTIENGVVNNSTIRGYYAGGIGGALTVPTKVSLNFSNYKNGYRKSDLTSYNYNVSVSKVAVKENNTVKGEQVGGLFGIINSGVVKDSYTRASLQGSNGNAIKGGFASSILSSGLTNVGGVGYAGIVENCYSACTFDGTGINYSICQSYVHNYNGSSSNNSRPAGYCFNYVFDNDLDGNAKYYSSGNIFRGDDIDAKKSSKDMKNANTYTSKEFSSAVWNFANDYPTLKIESSLNLK